MKLPMTPYKIFHWTLLAILLLFATNVHSAQVSYPKYTEQKVVFEFYFDHPQKIATALFWLKSYTQILTDEPYGYAIDDLDIKVIIHGTEIVTLAKNNYAKYTTIVQRMQYYAELGIDFRACILAAHDFGYEPEDLQDFVTLVPSALVDLAHWQLQGYAQITPVVTDKIFTTEEIR